MTATHDFQRHLPYEERVMGRAFTGEWPVERMEFEKGGEGPLAWLEYLAVRGAVAVAARVPRALGEGIVRGLAWFAYHVDRRHARAAREFLTVAFPDQDPRERERLVRGSFAHLFRIALVSTRMRRLMPGSRVGDYVDLDLCDDARELLDSGRGFVALTAHVGVWEAAGLPMGALGGMPAYGVVKLPHSGPLGRWLLRTRDEQGARMLPRRGAMSGIPKAVRAGGKVLLLMDQRARVKPVIAPFFGRPAECDRTISVLVRRIAAPVMVFGCYLTDRPDRLRLHSPKVIPAEELEGLDPQQVAARMNVEMEALARLAPEQYFWLHDRFRDAPGEGAAGGDAPQPEETDPGA